MEKRPTHAFDISIKIRSQIRILNQRRSTCLSLFDSSFT